ncbi:polymerase [Sonchus yellow net nucleorhabdovirus]|uniref:RNA-directed RNA polymerase L n=1 Tax=Sonchus yellow net virus TaxID=11307 RepID=L_SYNV|nr:polymerase [Sonchus yellow net nucleorhabdovirus]P31332.1 RecName: Full=RNA-directed RNA polymerase L; Short=Protein L; AltName: Full=Large structural protein; AltName: Full=Replicase; AltName: Full=Transcriptase; Includes: RecName: Full=RNA-directed RNA polymerase; Includes: RecName: Full=GTP phosphohydrolase; Includes: RecName: Full=GDP polyribonucleotidyltransferase; AltName: Full=PRNTase; Includes: RecName: Full=mRNA cap methyltransferase; AltName: Full=mRNA (guanine-N(7)-)-methyltransferas
MEGMDHWENAKYFQGIEDIEEDTRQPTVDSMSSGTYHCKSALRSHKDNMKLFLYRRDFLIFSHRFNGLPYDEQYLGVLPKLWSCFYDKTHDLSGFLDQYASREHCTPSDSFSRWADPTVLHLYDDPIIRNLLASENKVLNFLEGGISDILDKYQICIKRNIRLIYLHLFLNLALIVLNHTDADSMPDRRVELNGVTFKLEEGVILCEYNEYLKIYVLKGAVIWDMPAYRQVLQKDLFLTICDKISERINIVIGATIITALSHKTNLDDPDSHLYDACINMIKIGDNILVNHGNRGFDLLGKFEAYCVACILTYDDQRIWNPLEFLNNLIEDDRINQPDLYNDANNLVAFLRKQPIVILAELHGLWRIWGHPIIDLEGGMKKMEATCTKQSPVSVEETRVCERTMKLTFFTNYYDKHHHYPLSTLTHPDHFNLYSQYLSERDKIEYLANKDIAFEHSYIMRCIRRNKKIFQRSSLYNHKDWDQVVILQSFQIPKSVNLATMIKDKAISMTRSELIESVNTKNSVFDSTKRRGILKWLNEQSDKIYNFLMRIDDKGLDEDDCIIGLYPKEREMKTKARFFSLMSYKLRMYVTSTEELLGKYVLKYFPMITMSDNLLSMVIRLFDMTTLIGDKGVAVTYSMNIDFSKWNQNMRERTNAGIFDNLDRILGFRSLISRTHSIFKACYLYLCSGEYVPVISNNQLTAQSPWSRTGDESGKEGLRQKGWTITTVCDILSLAFKYNARIQLIGGGDNQVLTVTMLPSESMQSQGRDSQLLKVRERMTSFRNALAKKMVKRGLPLKLEETWISHNLLMYNKIMYYSGVPLRGRLKVISRLFSNSNVGVTSLGGITSTLGTGFQSISTKDYTPTLAWLISRVFTDIYISTYHLLNPISGTQRLDKQVLMSRGNIRQGRNELGGETSVPIINKIRNHAALATDHTLDLDSLLICVLYYHKILGGPGIGPPTAYVMKGFPDPLSEGLTFNYLVITNVLNERTKRKIISVTKVMKNRNQHWEHLLEDPVSVNHDAPPHGIAALRAQAEAVMRSAKITNIGFKNLIDIGDNQYLRDLSEKLCSPNDLEPRLLHDIVGSTIPGFVNSVLSRVDQSTTINKIAGNSDVVTSIYLSEMSYYLYLSKKVNTQDGHAIGSCPTRDSKMLRNWTWGKNIIGVTTPHPLGYLKRERHSESSSCDNNYIRVLTKRIGNSWELRRGQFRPYFGSYTEEKFKMTTLASAYGDESILKRAIKIQKLLGWRYHQGSSLYNLIQKILTCVTDADPNKFLPLPDEITGDVEHRYHDMATKHGGIPSNLIHLYTHASCNTSTFINHSKGAANESLHFQAAIIWTCMQSICRTSASSSVSDISHYHEACNQCIVKLEDPIESDYSTSDISLMSCPANDLMYVKEDDIPVHFHTTMEFYRASSSSTVLKKIKKIEDAEVISSRMTWVVTLCSHLLNQDTIKHSTWKLISEDLSKEEVMFIVMSITMYIMSEQDIPVHSASLSDFRTLYEKNKDIIDRVLGIEALNDAVSGVSFYNNRCSDDQCLRWKETSDQILSHYKTTGTCAVKYQAPHFRICTRLVYLMTNPSCQSCPCCLGVIKDDSNDGPIMCQLHGELAGPCGYHLCSLDKLNKTKKGLNMSKVFYTDGTISAQHDAKNRPTKKRPHGENSLTEMFKRAKTSRENRILKQNKESYLFIQPRLMVDLFIDMGSMWEKTQISDQGSHIIPAHTNPIVLSKKSDLYVPAAISKFVSNGFLIMDAVERALGKPSKPITEHSQLSVNISYGIEYHPEIKRETVQLLRFVNELAYTGYGGGVTICITLFPIFISDIEAVDPRLISDIIYRYRADSSDYACIRLTDMGDMCFDINNILSDCDACLSYDPGCWSQDANLVYIISDTSDIMIKAKEFETLHSFNKFYSVECLAPRFFMSSSTVSALVISKSSSINSIDYDRLAEIHLDRRGTQMWDLSRLFANMTMRDGLTEMIKCIYNNVSGEATILTSQSLVDAAISKIKVDILRGLIDMVRGERMNWRTQYMIQILLGVMILTSDNPEDYRREISKYNNAVVLLQKPRRIKLIRDHLGGADRKFYHATTNNGLLGSSLNDVTHILEGILYITHRTSRKLCTSISLEV